MTHKKTRKLLQPRYKFEAISVYSGEKVTGYYFYDEARNNGKHYLHFQDIKGNMRECQVYPESVRITQEAGFWEGIRIIAGKRNIFRRKIK